jgi:hypothetical protein
MYNLFMMFLVIKLTSCGHDIDVEGFSLTGELSFVLFLFVVSFGYDL